MPQPGFVERIDRHFGEALERVMASHHERRLRRLGQSDALDPPSAEGLWATTARAPHAGNSLEVLIDGSQVLPAIEEAIDGAREHVHVAGWHVDPDFVLRRDRPERALRDLLGDVADRADVRVLAWAGAPLPVIKPTRRMARECRRRLAAGTKVHAALDRKERPLHCHHEKIVVVDDALAFVGGVDLTALAGDRFDEPGHPARGRLGWHDAAVRIRGPLVAEVARHFAARWRQVVGEEVGTSAAHPRAGETEAQLARTVPERIYEFARHGEFSIVEAYLRALRSAERLVYLENQFLWSPEITAVLAAKLADPPRGDFRVVILLPERANNGQDDTRGQLGMLAEADKRGGGGRLVASTLRSRTGVRDERLYVHAKIGIVDDRWLTVGSANLNAHSFFNDSEVNVVTCDERLAGETRRRLWSEHLECAPEALDRDPAQVVDELWRPTATEQLERRRRGEPLTHHLVELPGVSRRSARLRGPLDALVVDA